MQPVSLFFVICLSALTAGCTNATVEDVGTFGHAGETYVIQSTTPGKTSEANSREQAVYSVEVAGEKVICNGSTSDCRAVTVERLLELEETEGS